MGQGRQVPPPSRLRHHPGRRSTAGRAPRPQSAPSPAAACPPVKTGGLRHSPRPCLWTMIGGMIRIAYRVHKGRMMAESENNPIRNEPVKPPMLNPVVRHILPSGDLKWILIAVGLAAAVGLLALLFGAWY